MYYKLPEKQLNMTIGIEKERNSLHVGSHKNIKSRIKVSTQLLLISNHATFLMMPLFNFDLLSLNPFTKLLASLADFIKQKSNFSSLFFSSHISWGSFIPWLSQNFMLLDCVFSMLVMLEILVTTIDVSIAYVNLEVAMNSGDVSTVTFSAISTTNLCL
jgi:hypothetical protein